MGGLSWTVTCWKPEQLTTRKRLQTSGPLHREKNNVKVVLDNSQIQPAHIVLQTRTPNPSKSSIDFDPRVARSALNHLLVPPINDRGSGIKEGPVEAIDFFDQSEIYPVHFFSPVPPLRSSPCTKNIIQLFFDDEHRNKEVEELGVTFHFVRNGLDDRTFERGLAEWRKRHPVEVVDDAAGSSS
ncbi:hypothetical protein FB446DRAFT_824581 [Lentinula raphanica]|nr:hypothetical protein FB446DRAFT_824581 [Lentinula raphanica]